ncbi:type II secretion system inner membrane protein GspF [Zooshikella marina]|uniref:type II secretion system inner membrane protein GspF n=1 Tax=Zooshikella ganghwensis TaxID=202772 RepID=UPI001BB0A0CF|nr:type II secretion system inner membrane protein GspF [Zooshikella ganghwensis]MBU2704407.1 type II secretion system inner membrane protein GspF [Zooshikella ganghwensis]
MAAYEFTALNAKGKQERGTLEADSARQVRQLLREKKLTPLTVEVASQQERKAKGGGSILAGGISTSALALLIRQLATLIQAALPIEEALRAVAEQQEKQRIKNIVLSVRSKVLEGYTLAQSMECFPGVFPSMYCATVSAGEHAGFLDKVLNQLADYSESRQQSQQKIKMALVYPALLILASFGIVAFLLGFVVPDIVKVFIDSGQELPALTTILISLSDVFKDFWYLIVLAIIGIVVTTRYLLSKPPIKLRFHRFILRVPLVGRLNRQMNTARFASTLSILTRSGVPLVEALKIATEVVSNLYIKQALSTLPQQVSEGVSLTKAMEQTGHFAPMMLHMIASGEASGELDDMLERTARSQETDLESRMAVIVGLFEPLTLMFMGGIVLIIVLAVLLPILNMNQLLG